jgi:hypothetical protein
VANLTSSQEGVCYASINTFNVLPIFVAELTNKKHLIAALKKKKISN